MPNLLRLSPQELREQIADIASRVNDPENHAFYLNNSNGVHSRDNAAQDDLIFLLDLLDQMATDCYELTPAARELLGDRDNEQA